MNKIYRITIFSILIIVSCKPTTSDKPLNEKLEMKKVKQTDLDLKTDVNEITNTLFSASSWYKKTKEEWALQQSVYEGEKNWAKDIILWTDTSSFFSKKFIINQKKNHEQNRFEHFGLMFFGYGLGQMLNSLCDPEELNTHIVKEEDDKYRYTTAFYKVLNDVPIPDQAEGFLWLWDKGENGEVWQFSIILIKENDKWVIDEIDRYFGVPVEKSK